MDMIISKWGNSLGVRIPNAVAKEAGIGVGAPVHVSAVKGRIVLEPIRYNLETLVNGITARNRHDTIETGAPRGSEIW